MALAKLTRFLLPCCAAPLVAAAPPPDSIAFELNSWGSPVSSWRIARDGAVEYRYRRPLAGSEGNEVDLVTKRLQLNPEALARVQALLRPVLRRRSIICRQRDIFDLPYGGISWQAGGGTHDLRFNLGCSGGSFQRAYDRLYEAAQVIEEAARSAPEIEARRIPARLTQ